MWFSHKSEFDLCYGLHFQYHLTAHLTVHLTAVSSLLITSQPKMGRVFLIEPVVGVYAFAMFMTYPLVQQYVYRRQWEKIIGSPYPTVLNISHCGGNLSTQHGVRREGERAYNRSVLFRGT